MGLVDPQGLFNLYKQVCLSSTIITRLSSRPLAQLDPSTNSTLLRLC